MGPIRGFTPAAPLKREGEWEGMTYPSHYPRVHTRGPIEAIFRMNSIAPFNFLSAGSHPRPH